MPEPVFKVGWQGKVIGVQPRIRLLRSFDERSHSYLGYLLYLSGTVTEQARDFSVGIERPPRPQVWISGRRKPSYTAGDGIIYPPHSPR